MAKMLLKLKKDSFLDLYGNQYILANRPYVVEGTNAMQGLCAAGKAELMAHLKDGATDEKFVKAIEKDAKKGLNAFLAEFDAKAKESAPANPASNDGNANPNPEKK